MGEVRVAVLAATAVTVGNLIHFGVNSRYSATGCERRYLITFDITFDIIAES